jgi:hypothetical protein
LEEQLDIERERVNELIKTITGQNQHLDDTDVNEIKESRPSKSWAQQRVRLVQRSMQEHADRLQKIKDNEKAI